MMPVLKERDGKNGSMELTKGNSIYMKFGIPLLKKGNTLVKMFFYVSGFVLLKT